MFLVCGICWLLDCQRERLMDKLLGCFRFVWFSCCFSSSLFSGMMGCTLSCTKMFRICCLVFPCLLFLVFALLLPLARSQRGGNMTGGFPKKRRGTTRASLQEEKLLMFLGRHRGSQQPSSPLLLSSLVLFSASVCLHLWLHLPLSASVLLAPPFLSCVCCEEWRASSNCSFAVIG
jgi:hypothetical protein